MNEDEIQKLIDTLRRNRESCPKEFIEQAADQLERMIQWTVVLNAVYDQVSQQRDLMMDAQSSMLWALRGRKQ